MNLNPPRYVKYKPCDGRPSMQPWGPTSRQERLGMEVAGSIVCEKSLP